MSGITRLDWGHSYEVTARETAKTLRAKREAGAVLHVFGDGAAFEVAPCDPSRMSDRQIDEVSRLHAERVCNRAINQEVDNRRRRGLPLHGMVEEVDATPRPSPPKRHLAHPRAVAAFVRVDDDGRQVGERLLHEFDACGGE